MKPKAIAFILMLLALVGIAGSIHDQVEPPPAPVKAPSSVAENEGGACAPCLGPHLNVMNGRIELLPSMGPGIEF